MYQITSPEGLKVKRHFYPLDAELSSERLDVTVIVHVARLLHNFNRKTSHITTLEQCLLKGGFNVESNRKHGKRIIDIIHCVESYGEFLKFHPEEVFFSSMTWTFFAKKIPPTLKPNWMFIDRIRLLPFPILIAEVSININQQVLCFLIHSTNCRNCLKKRQWMHRHI